jgi:hypothetical protein
MKWTAASLASLIVGRNQSTNGRSTVDVFTAENSAVEANEMNTIHSKSGT